MCDVGRLECERPTTRKDGLCRPCATYYRRLEREMEKWERAEEARVERAEIREELRSLGLV